MTYDVRTLDQRTEQETACFPFTDDEYQMLVNELLPASGWSRIDTEGPGEEYVNSTGTFRLVVTPVID